MLQNLNQRMVKHSVVIRIPKTSPQQTPTAPCCAQMKWPAGKIRSEYCIMIAYTYIHYMPVSPKDELNAAVRVKDLND